MGFCLVLYLDYFRAFPSLEYRCHCALPFIVLLEEYNVLLKFIDTLSFASPGFFYYQHLF